MHVEEPEGVRLLAADLVGRAPRVLPEPGVAPEVRVRVPKALGRRGPSATGPLPLRFRG